MVGTLRVDETLRSAAHIGVSNVVLDTPTGPGSVPGAALRVGPAGRGVAGVDDLRPGDDLRQERTAGERISAVARGTGTDGVVIDSRTASIVTTGSHTGGATLLGYTGLAGRTLSIEDTLRSAVGRNSYEAWQASTGLVTIHFSTLSIGSAG